MSKQLVIPLKDLQSFKKNADFIKINPILPALEYLKFDNGRIIKNNLSEFIIQELPFVGSFMVEERILMNFLNFAKDDVAFAFNNKKIIISDGYTSVTSQIGDAETFPADYEIPEWNTLLQSEILEAISTASKFTEEDNLSPIKPFVFIGRGSICASNNVTAFCATIREDIPEIILNKLTAAKIGSFDELKHSSNEKYNFFRSENITYGFIKPEVNFSDMSIFFKFERGDSFIVPRNELVEFNDMCISISPSKLILPSFKIEDKKLKLSMTDNDYEIDINRSLPCDGIMDGSFSYIAQLMSGLLKCAPDSELIFYQAKDKFYIIGESGFQTLIMRHYGKV